MYIEEIFREKVFPDLSMNCAVLQTVWHPNLKCLDAVCVLIWNVLALLTISCRAFSCLRSKAYVRRDEPRAERLRRLSIWLLQRLER